MSVELSMKNIYNLRARSNQTWGYTVCLEMFEYLGLIRRFFLLYLYDSSFLIRFCTFKISQPVIETNKTMLVYFLGGAYITNIQTIGTICKISYFIKSSQTWGYTVC